MATVDRFSELVGKVIKGCGMLEFNVNFHIKNFSKDPILVRHVLKLPLNRRIKIMRDLMLERQELSSRDVDFLCKVLEKIAEERNVIAHNPAIISTNFAAGVAPVSEGPHILDLLHSSDSSNPKKITEADLESLDKRVMKTLETLAAIINKPPTP